MNRQSNRPPPDAAHSILEKSYAQLMEINQTLTQQDSYEAAYHALMAALECANDFQDEQRLTTVQETATAQRDRLDQEIPEHPMSTQSAQQRGQSLYNILIRQANVASPPNKTHPPLASFWYEKANSRFGDRSCHH